MSYQWRKGSNPISGATAISYAAKTTGTYKCIVTKSNGCTKLSNGLTTNVNCKGDIAPLIAFELFPNPPTNEVYLETDFDLPENSVIELYDMTGRKISVEIIQINASTMSFDVSNLADASYAVVLRTNENVWKKILMVKK